MGLEACAFSMAINNRNGDTVDDGINDPRA